MVLMFVLRGKCLRMRHGVSMAPFCQDMGIAEEGS